MSREIWSGEDIRKYNKLNLDLKKIVPSDLERPVIVQAGCEEGVALLKPRGQY